MTSSSTDTGPVVGLWAANTSGAETHDAVTTSAGRAGAVHRKRGQRQRPRGRGRGRHGSQEGQPRLPRPLVAVRHFKADQEALGQIVGVAAGVRAATDPIPALRVWLHLRPRRPGPLFSRVPATRPITSEVVGRRTVSDLVRNRATAAGLADLGVSGHSLRAGHATTAAVNGATIDRITAHSRHRDLTPLFNHYIRPVDALATTTSRDLGLGGAACPQGQSRSAAPGHRSARRGVLLVPPRNCTLSR